MNKEYFISQAKKAIKKANDDLIIVNFICENNTLYYDTFYKDNKKGIHFYDREEKYQRFFWGDYEHLTILKKLKNKSKYADMNLEELKHIAKTYNNFPEK